MPVALFFLLALPYLSRFAIKRSTGAEISGGPPFILGAVPKGAGGLAMTAALGPAALLTTPQGKAALSKGLTLAQNARNGDPKAKKAVRVKVARARAGDPVAKKEVAVLKAAVAVQNAQAQGRGGGDEDEDDYDDEDYSEDEE